MGSVKALYYNCLDIGKHVKKSKKRYIWKFSIDGQEHTIDLVVSFLSGKKKITQDGRMLYEGKKVLTSTFQYSFEIGNNLLKIDQKGENFELRIDNNSFSDLYGRGGYRGNDFEGSNSYGSKSEYGGHGSQSARNEYGGYGSNSRDRDNYSGSRGDFSGSRGDYSGSGSQAQYKQPSQNSSNRGWDDVKHASREARSGTSNFESQGSFKRSETEKKSTAPSAFDDFGQTSQTKKNDFTDFSSFNNFEQKPKKQESNFADFNNFGNSNTQAPPSRQAEVKKPQPPKENLDILGLDFGNQNVNPNPQPQTNGGGFDDFFGQPQKPVQNQGFGTPSQANVQTQQKPQQSGDLFSLGLDFSETQPPQNNTVTSQPQESLLGFDQPQTQSQPTVQTSQINQSQPLAQPQNNKKDLWSTDLVSLDPSEVGNNKNQNQYGNQDNFNFNKPSGGYNNNAGGYGNQNNMGFGNNNSNFGGYGGMNNNAGGYGGMGMSMGGMNMNMGMNNNAGGFGGMNSNAGFGNMNNGGFGGMNQNFGGYNNNQGNFGMGMGMGGGFQQQQQAGFVNQGNSSTPFDF